MKKLYIILLAVCLLGSNLNSVAQIANYDFNNCSGAIVNDNINNLNGTLVGATWTEGYNGQSLSFDGINDKITVLHDPQLSITQAITVSSWIKAPLQPNDMGVIVGKHEGGNTNDQRSWLMSSPSAIIVEKDKLQVVISEDGTNDAGQLKLYYSSIPVFDDAWHHVAFTFESGVLKLFIDGQEDVNVVKYKDGAVDNLYANTADLTIGYHLNNNNASRYFKGKIDELKIHNSALSPAEITALASQPYAPADCVEGYPVLWTNLIDAEYATNVLRKTTASSDWNSGASSVNTLVGGEDGWIEMTAQEVDKKRMFGFAESDNPGINDINYAIYLRLNGEYYVYENGVNKGMKGTYFQGDRFKVSRESGTVKYYKNDVLRYTSTITSATSLIVDVALYNLNASISDAMASFEHLPNGQVYDNLEIAALKSLYESTNGANWTDNTGWPVDEAAWSAITSVDQIVGWYGVATLNGDVTEIQIKNNNLSGVIPNSLGNVSALLKLDLGQFNSSNNLTGNIPASLGNLNSLTHLILTGNSLTGSIPSEVFEIATLTHCILSQNNLSGSIPANVGNAINLYDLTLAINNLTGAIPPSIGNLTNLNTLHIGTNNYDGGIPAEIGGLASLRYINISGGNLTGVIPTELGQCTNLNTIYLGHNNLEGAIPSSIGNLVQMQNLFLNNNNLSGEMGLLFENFIALRQLVLDRNNMTGNIPSYLLQFDALQFVHFWSNNFTSIPNFSTHTNATNLNLQIQNNRIPQSDINANLNGDGTNDFSVFTFDPQQTPNGQVFDDVEIQALRDLYESTNGANWTDNSGWPTDEAAWSAITSVDQVVGWHGVTTLNGDVIEISQYNNNLVAVEIPVMLTNLTGLKILNLGANTIAGSIPAEISNLISLEELILNGNEHTGSIPVEINSLVNLSYLNLSSKTLGGPLPSLVNLINLEVLVLADFKNRLNLTEFPQWVQGMTNLRNITLSKTEINNSLPDWIGDFSQLEALKLSSCQLSGELPLQIGNLTKLRQLLINNNELSGQLPNSIGNLSQLSFLYAYANNFSGSMPQELLQLSSATRIFLSNNEFSSLPDFTAHPNLSVLKLSVDRNRIPQSYIDANLNQDGTHSFAAFTYSPQQAPNGTVYDHVEIQALRDLYESTAGANWTDNTGWPVDEAAWSAITSVDQVVGWKGVTILNGDISQIDLSTNSLSGSLPSTIGDLGQLLILRLENNQIGGTIPSQIGNLASMLEIKLQGNLLTGAIPSELGNLVNMTVLYLQGNQLTGSLPTSFGNLVKMRSLVINNNQLSGSIPIELSNLIEMHTLYLQENQLSGTIPTELGNLTEMKYLFLSDNNLSGEIPSTLGSLANLRSLNLSSNSIKGTIPPSLGNLNSLVVLALNGNQLSGIIPAEIGNLGTNMTTMHLHDNQLGGAIPISLSNLVNLRDLRLHVNQLTGAIPVTLGDLIKMKFLYLNNNQLTGSIPATLGSNFDNASYIYLYDNQLAGDVPAGLFNSSVLRRLYLYDNNFTSLPIATTHPNVGNLELRVQNNNLPYANIETNLNTGGGHVFKTFLYAGQSNNNPTFPTEGVVTGTQLIIDTHDASINNIYLWEKLDEDGTTWIDVATANENPTGDRYVKTITSEETKTYRYTITNSLINQNKTSDPILIEVVDANPTTEDLTHKPLYDGTITAMAWRAEEAFATDDTEDTKGMYLFDYDNQYQLKSAIWATPNFSTNSFTASSNQYRVTNLNYDHNGNITSLRRYDDMALKLHDFKYNYNGTNNKLTSVDGYAEYSYNALGQMIRQVDDEDGQEKHVEYDVTGKVTHIYSDAAKTKLKVAYKYDDRGFRLAKIGYEEDGVTQGKSTWYIRDASGNVMSIYEKENEGADLVQVEVPVYGSGKIGVYYPQKSTGKMAYELTDHLGNVRAVVKDDTETVYLATMESGGAPTENTLFEEVAFKDFGNTRVATVPEVNHTPIDHTGAQPEVVRLNGGRAVTAGPGKSLTVRPGDRIEVEVYAKYLDLREDNGLGAAAILAALYDPTSTLGVAIGDGVAASVITDPNSGVTALLGGSGAGAPPQAAVNLIWTDSDGNPLDAAARLITTSAAIDPTNLGSAHEKLTLSMEITQSGLVDVYLSAQNSEDADIYFDDFKVTHYRSKVVTQTTDYYPFGSILRTAKTNEENHYRYGYQGSFSEEDEETGWNSFELRMLDPVIGRWTSTDPAGQFSSPYTSMGNNPVNGVDPDGAFTDFLFDSNGDYQGTKNDNWLHTLFFGNRGVLLNSDGGFGSTFRFADSKNDAAQLRSGDINRLVFVNEGNIKGLLSNAGAFQDLNFGDAISYLRAEGVGGGRLDFSYTSIPGTFTGASNDPLSVPSPMLFLVNSTAHNHMNFGNFLFGASGEALGVPLLGLQSAAHLNSLGVFGNHNGYDPQLDSSDDQLSIRLGYYYSIKKGY